MLNSRLQDNRYITVQILHGFHKIACKNEHFQKYFSWKFILEPGLGTIFCDFLYAVDTAHTRIKKHALNQALYTAYKKIVFGTRVRKCFYPRVAFPPSLRSGANIATRIKSLCRTCIENNYFLIAVFVGQPQRLFRNEISGNYCSESRTVVDYYFYLRMSS